MSNIEKLRQKIENSIKAFEFNGGIYDSYEAGELSAYQEILNIIDSLPEEKPSEDLEEEVKRYYSDNFTYISSDQPTLSILTNVARHFAEWQKEQMMDEWLKDRDGCFWDGVNEGKKAMKEQMMKDAVEGEVIYDLGGFFRIKSEAIDGAKYKVGSWVKLIIVKED